jgi:hypothetical protein
MPAPTTGKKPAITGSILLKIMSINRRWRVMGENKNGKSPP